MIIFKTLTIINYIINKLDEHLTYPHLQESTATRFGYFFFRDYLHAKGIYGVKF